MPRLSQLMIRTALIWLAIGSTAGGLVLLEKGMPLQSLLWVLRGSHVHMLLVGWIVQFAWGVAFWILPRLNAAGSRGNERLAWMCYVVLNGGVVLGALADMPAALAPGSTAPALQELRAALPPLMGLCYLLAAALFFVHAWPRVVPFRTLPRPTRDK